jgi:ABC-type phosphate/phosphonate transport system substrate-binding protein
MSPILVFQKSLHRFSHRLLLQLFCALLLLNGSALAMDPRYQDADGDMIADVPSDSKDWVDPPTLVFAYTPVEDPAVYAKVWDGFIRHMEKVTGKKVQFFPVQSNAAQLEACGQAGCMSPALTPALTLWPSTVPVFDPLP